MARKVICLETLEVFGGAVCMSKYKGINLSTLKKYLYKNNIYKFRCQWYDIYMEDKSIQQEINNE